MSRNGKFIFGALVGALFGLAFAPKKGSDLRKELQTEIEKGGRGEKTLQKNATIMGEDISTTAQEVYQAPVVQEQIKKGKKEVAKLAEQAKETLQSSGEEWVQVAREKLVEGKEMVQKEAGKAFDTIKKASTQKPKSAGPSAKPTSKAKGKKK